ncbi:MAG: gamma-glutamyl-gamma-aminobutyrate hydrolase family protein [Candidatus Limnocylindrales bacterium]
MTDGPRIVLTVAVAADQADPALAERKMALYAAAIARHGGEPVILDGAASPGERDEALSTMDGLLLTGGADVDPARYGRPSAGSRDVDRDRDGLEAEAWQVATERGLPVLGICRGFQLLNVLHGGTLLQDVAGHAGPSYGQGAARSHPLRVVAGTRLARILFPTNVRGGVLPVNSYHHQGVRTADLAPGLIASAWAASPAGDLVEGLESEAGASRFVIGVQCHPERTDSTPDAFERLWRVFVDACRGSVAARASASRSLVR